MNDFADMLIRLRKEKGLSQAGLAAAASIPVGTIRQLEQMRRDPTLGTLVKLARGLGVSLAVFDPLLTQPEPAGKPARASSAGKAAREPSGAGEALLNKAEGKKRKRKGT